MGRCLGRPGIRIMKKWIFGVLLVLVVTTFAWCDWTTIWSKNYTNKGFWPWETSVVGFTANFQVYLDSTVYKESDGKGYFKNSIQFRFICNDNDWDLTEYAARLYYADSSSSSHLKDEYKNQKKIKEH